MDRSGSTALWGRVLSCALIGYILYGLAIYWFKLTFVIPNGINYWQFTEWLINYEGGFVRRGLLGEMLYWFCSHTGIGPRYIISFASLAIYLSLFYFFFKKFRERGLCCWFLAAPFMFGYVEWVIRKDFLMIWLLIAILIMLNHKQIPLKNQLGAIALSILGILIHESFLFFACPLTLLLIRRKGNSNLFWIFIFSLFIEIILICYFRGSLDTVEKIRISWNKFISSPQLVIYHHNSLGALFWDLKETILYHLKNNIGYNYYCSGLLIRPIGAFFAYYLLVNFMKFFQSKKGIFSTDDATNIGALFIILAISMFPLFSVLSCDYARLYQYEGLTITGAYIVLDREILTGIIPKRILDFSRRFNEFTCTLLPPSRGLLMSLFLLWGAAPGWYDMNLALSESIIGKLAILIGGGFNYLF